jgi:glyoxylase-like metal-dependent hydrolase (beta-lactamase superfamily II)
MSGQTPQSPTVMPTPPGFRPSQPPQPRIDRFSLGPFDTNCYVLSPQGSPAPAPNASTSARPTPCWIIDASFEPQPIIEHIRSEKLNPEALILTHAHVDHMAGVRDVLAAFPGTPLLIHEAEAGWLNDPLLNLSAMMGMPITAPLATRLLRDGDTLTLAGQSWTVIHTPGHSPGGIALYNAASHTALSGDALFAGSIGRTDFPGSDHETLLRSIKSRLYTLPENTRLWPGHGPDTTIGRERLSNPFVRG